MLLSTENWATWDEILPSNTCFSASILSTLSCWCSFCLIVMPPPVLSWCILIYSIKASACSLKLVAFPVLYARKENRLVFISSGIVCQLHTPQLFLVVRCCTALLQSPKGTWGSVWAKRNCAFLWNMKAYTIPFVCLPQVLPLVSTSGFFSSLLVSSPSEDTQSDLFLSYEV